MVYAATLSSAKSYAEALKLDEWIHTYLCGDGKNRPFSDGLKLMERYFIGPIEMPTALFERCTGPEEGMKFRTGREEFQRYVAQIERHIQRDPDMPPLIINYMDGCFVTNDGNHRLQAYKNLGIEKIPVIIWITEADAYDEFVMKFHDYAKSAPVIRS